MTAPTALRGRAIPALAMAAACAILTLTAGAAAKPPVAVAAIPAITGSLTGIPVSGPGAQPAVDPVTGTAFVASGQPSDNLAVVDMSAGTLTATIPVGAVFGAEAVDPATGLVYTANRFADSVSVVSPAAGTVTATITGLPGEPMAIAADPVTDRIYVGLYERSTPAEIAVIDGSTNTLATTITLPAGTLGGTGADGIAVNPDTGTVYLSFCGEPCYADIIDDRVVGRGQSVRAQVHARPGRAAGRRPRRPRPSR